MKKAYVYSHTHWDREWYLTQRQFQFLLARTFDEILDVLETNPRFKTFVADGQTIIFQDYCELHPDNKKRFLALASAGRLEMGPWYTMPDMWIPTGESIIRNLLKGCLDCEELGLPHPKTGYVPDSFGHPEQMPQIMNGFGITNYVFGRGDTMAGLGASMQFLWTAPDGGSSVTAHRLEPDGYSSGLGLAPSDGPERLRRQVGRILNHYETKSAKPDLALICNGIDHIWIQPDLPEALDMLRSLFPDWEFVHTTLSEYAKAFDAAAAERPLTKETGCLHGSHLHEGMLHGTWSSRMDIKLANAASEKTLVNLAEPLSAIAGIYGGPDRRPETDLAWRWLLANHAHDSICGCSGDATHADGIRRFGHVIEMGEMIAAEALEELNANAIRHDSPTLIRYAGLGGASGCQEFLIDRQTDSEQAPFHFVDADGNPIPIQVTNCRKLIRSDVALDGGEWRHGESTQLRFHEIRGVTLLPEASPCSVVRYALAEGYGPDLPHTDLVTTAAYGDGAVMENSDLRVDVHADGTLAVLHKPSATKYSGLLELVDEADLGGGYVFRPLPNDERRSSKEAAFVVRVLEDGPLRAAISMEGVWELPEDLDKARTHRTNPKSVVVVKTIVRLETGSDALHCRMALDNGCRDHRIRLRLPLPYSTRAADVERSFVIAREDMAAYTADPGQNSHPMGSWVSVPSPDGRHGLAFVSRGLHEYALSSDDAAETGSLELTLLRCVPFVYDCGSWETPAAQMQGITEFDFSLIFHTGSWRDGGIAAAAHRFVYPSICEVGGSLRPGWDDLFHASVALAEVLEDGSQSNVDAHRSGWKQVLGHRDGWRRREKRLLPALDAPRSIEPVRIDDPDILVSALKRAERAPQGGRDGSGDIIIRLYSLAESQKSVTVRIGIPFRRIRTADMSETPIGDALAAKDGIIELSIRPFEIITLRLSM